MASPLDPRQLRWWHRIRRFGIVAFVVGAGGVLTSAIVIGFHVAVVILYFGSTWSVVRGYLGNIAAVVVPICLFAFTWTWSYMERRYRATLGVMCPKCAYRLDGIASAACPECGRTIAGETS